MSEQASQLHRRRITLADGRYMIFYTFGEEPKVSSPDPNVARPKPEPEPQATEERSV